MWARAAKAHTVALDGLHPADYIVWLEGILPTLKPATRRQYIAAAKAWLATLVDAPYKYSGSIDELKIIFQKCNEMQSCNYTPQVKSKQWRANTSGQKAKKVTVTEIFSLLKVVGNRKGKWIKPALVWMLANISVGLRPVEWRNASLSEVDSRLILVVVNAKNTNGRSHGKLRHIDITDLKSTEIQWVKTQLHAIQYLAKDDKKWSTYYSGVRHNIRNITRELLPKQRKYPTLYSTRHQFSANAKSEGMSKIEVAALMGHATDETATMHYGKKKYGSGSCRVKADVNEMQKIRLKSSPMIYKRPRIS